MAASERSRVAMTARLSGDDRELGGVAVAARSGVSERLCGAVWQWQHVAACGRHVAASVAACSDGCESSMDGGGV